MLWFPCDAVLDYHSCTLSPSSKRVLPTRSFYLLASTADVVNRDVNYQKRTVKSFIPHPYFSWSLIYHDIGLIEASGPFDYNGYISLAVLPRPDWNFHLDSWITCSVAGWGVTNKNEPQRVSNKLMSVTLDVAPKEVCEKGIGGSSFENPGGSICTYSVNGTKDACKGDSGSALVCNHPEMKGNVLLPDLASDWAINGWNLDQWRQGIVLGIVSWSWECAHDGVPAVFTDVRQYRDWVRCTVLSARSSTNTASVFFIGFVTTLFQLALN
ncbi:trypsin-1-like isoform X2 [Ischnura elegans]|uniref:trypsin-1-like isoform X2 n=1 Tax=Ischnura elegans TaxID=197161 RepID=UPI001ED896AF|nr:trypsin-1-like isoform X2 [Ischnura elegans]